MRLSNLLLQIEWTDLNYTVDDFGRTVYSFPVHIRILIGVTALFVLVIFILLGVILSSRIFKTKRALRKAQILQKYQPVFRELLFNNGNLSQESLASFDPGDLKNNPNRATILEEIIHLHENFTGETADRLEEIYLLLGFDVDSINKLNDKKWYVVAKGMRELALMNVKSAIEPISTYLSSDHQILRLECRIALMKLSIGDPLSFLSQEKGELTDWDTANIYAMLSKMPEHLIPDFSFWLSSPNKDVVLFCIRMIGTFRQQNSANVLILLARNEDPVIKSSSIKALRELNATLAEQTLIDMYPLENKEIKKEILRTLEVIGSAPSVLLLDKIIRQPLDDFPLAIQAVRALIANGEQGLKTVDRILENAGPQLQLIIQHARDKRL